MTDRLRAGDPPPMAPTGSAFVERVMSRVASSPLPSSPRSFVTAARERSLRDVRGALAVAWHIALHSRVPAVVRVQALGLVAVIALSVGAVSVAASAAAYRFAAPLVASVITQDTLDRRSLPVATPAPLASPVDASPALEPSPEADAVEDDGDSGRNAAQSGPNAATGDQADDLDGDAVDQVRDDPADVESDQEPDEDEEDPADEGDRADADEPSDADDESDEEAGADATEPSDADDESDEEDVEDADDPEDPSGD